MRVSCMWLTGIVLLAVACSPDPASQPADETQPAEAAEAVAPSQIAAWDCEDGSSIISELRPESDEVFLILPEESLALPRSTTASGARYENERITFRIEGEEATLARRSMKIACTRNARDSVIARSKLAGNDFWGIGNEPGWTLVIGPEEIVWVTDYGQTRHTLARPESRSKSDSTSWEGEIDEQSFSVTLSLGPCHDDMSGEEFETVVIIQHGDRTYRGCGVGLH